MKKLLITVIAYFLTFSSALAYELEVEAMVYGNMLLSEDVQECIRSNGNYIKDAVYSGLSRF